MGSFKPSADQLAWSKLFLRALHAPVTNSNVVNVAAWEQAESGQNIGPAKGKSGGVWNPLNCVRTPGIPDVGMGGSQGNIANYASLSDGATQSARWWSTNNHAGARLIVQVLKFNDKPATTQAESDSAALTLNNAINTFYATWGGHIVLPNVSPNDAGDLHDFQSGGDSGAATGIDDPLTATGKVVGNVVSAVPSWLADRLGPLATRAFWIRAGEMALGFFLIIVGLVMLLKGLAPPAAVSALKAAVVA